MTVNSNHISYPNVDDADEGKKNLTYSLQFYKRWLNGLTLMWPLYANKNVMCSMKAILSFVATFSLDK